MASLKEYQARIDRMAFKKGWSYDNSWLRLGIFKEVGELVAEMEKTDAMFHDGGQEITDAYNRIGKEFGDVIFYLFQAMRAYDIDIDQALEYVFSDNASKKKKTIDANGKIIRK